MLTCLTAPFIPHPPKEIIARALDQVDKYHNGTADLDKKPTNDHIYNSAYAQRIYNRHGVPTPTRRQNVFSLGEDFEQWAKDHVHPYPYEVGLSMSVPVEAPIQGPHMDPRRRYALNYLLDTGGENVHTVFYKEKGFPIERPEAVGPEGKSYWSDYANLEVIEDVILSPGVWVILNAKVLHSVENLVGYRAMLTVSVPDLHQFPWKNRNPV